MKLFNAIAAATVIGASFITTTPAEARNGWIYDGQNNKNYSVYWRPLGCSGNICRFESKHANHNGSSTNSINCSSWKISFSGSTYEDLMPGSNGENKANQMCR